jgi:hypothetical protein
MARTSLHAVPEEGPNVGPAQSFEKVFELGFQPSKGVV